MVDGPKGGVVTIGTGFASGPRAEQEHPLGPVGCNQPPHELSKLLIVRDGAFRPYHVLCQSAASCFTSQHPGVLGPEIKCQCVRLRSFGDLSAATEG